MTEGCGPQVTVTLNPVAVFVDLHTYSSFKEAFAKHSPMGCGLRNTEQTPTLPLQAGVLMNLGIDIGQQ